MVPAGTIQTPWPWALISHEWAEAALMDAEVSRFGLETGSGLWTDLFPILREHGASAWLPLVAPLPRDTALRVVRSASMAHPAPACFLPADGSALALSPAYDKACPEQAGRLHGPGAGGDFGSRAQSSSLARALRLINSTRVALSCSAIRPTAAWAGLLVTGVGRRRDKSALGWDLSRRALAGKLLDQPG